MATITIAGLTAGSTATLPTMQGPVDAAEFGHDTPAVRVTCHGERATIAGNDGDNRLVGTKRRDVIVAHAGDDRIFGRGGRDLICGGADFDILHGNRGDDYLRGGNGYDVVDYRSASRGVSVRLPGGSAAGEGKDRILGVDGAYGSRYDDTIYGTPRSGNFWGRAGDDTIYGSGGADRIFGDSGSDTLQDSRGRPNELFGERGNDRIAIAPIYDLAKGGSGSDVLMFTTTLGVTVDLSARQVTYPGDALIDSFESVYGTAGPDAIYGSAPAENFYTGDGDDYVDGDLGLDYADAGYGNDRCVNVEYAYYCEY